MAWKMIHRQLWFEEIIMYAPAILNIDSSATLALSMTKQASTWTKHIDSKYHFGKDAFKAG